MTVISIETLKQSKDLPEDVVIHGNCINVIENLPENSIDALVSDFPYGIGFMNANWDTYTKNQYQNLCYNIGKKTIKLLKSGAFLSTFTSPKTYHRVGVGIEDAGYEIRDMIEWFYGNSLIHGIDISKEIDASFGKLEDRKTIGRYLNPDGIPRNYEEHKKVETTSYGSIVEKYNSQGRPITRPATKQSKKWEGWYSSLKTLHEPILLAQKPREGTFVENILERNVGALNIDACRVPYAPHKETDNRVGTNAEWHGTRQASEHTVSLPAIKGMKMYKQKGRFPPNVIFTHHPKCKMIGIKNVKSNGHWTKTKITGYGKFGNGKEVYYGKGFKPRKERRMDYQCHPNCPIRILDEQSGERGNNYRPNLIGKDYKTKGYGTIPAGQSPLETMYNDNGGASRFFYCAKAYKTERNAGCEDLYWGKEEDDLIQITKEEYNRLPRSKRRKGNPIISLKPINLMRWLVRLVCPKGGTILDPFGGSGTTAIACIIEGMNYIVIEKRNAFANIIIPRRIKYWEDPTHWDLLKDHNALPKIEQIKNKNQNLSLKEWM